MQPVVPVNFWTPVLTEMPEAKVSWTVYLGRLVSKIDNIMHLLHLIDKIGKYMMKIYALGTTSCLAQCLVKQAMVYYSHVNLSDTK